RRDQLDEHRLDAPLCVSVGDRLGPGAAPHRRHRARGSVPGLARALGLAGRSARIRIGGPPLRRIASLTLAAALLASSLSAAPASGRTVMEEVDKRRRTPAEYSEGLITVDEKG